GLVSLRPWRDAAVEHAVESRGLAESITGALERRGFGPASVRERLPLPLVGVHPPGILLDCGALSTPEERARLLASGGLRALAAGTALLHAYLDEAGLLTLDLSRPFRQGFEGGARAEELTLASLVRTLGAGVPEARRVRIVCAGVALQTLGGHFPLDQPLDFD